MSDALAKATEPTVSVALAAGGAPDLPSLFRLAKALKEAHGFIPKHFKSEGEIVAAILTGQEMGLPPMTALRSIHVVEGKPALDASMQLALAKKAGIKHRWDADGSDGKLARLWLQRPGDEPHTQSYSIEDAKRAGLTGKQTWQKHTAAMLRARCISAAMRAYCPDVLGGAVYVPDELDEIRDAAPVASLAPRDDGPKTLAGVPRATNHDGTPAAKLTARAAVEELRADPEMRERIDRANAEGAAREAEAARTVDQWIEDWKTLKTPRDVEAWVHFNGFAMRELPEKARTKARTLFLVNKSSVVQSLGMNPKEVRDWIMAAEELPLPENDEGSAYEPPEDVYGVERDYVDGPVLAAAEEREAQRVVETQERVIDHDPDEKLRFGKHKGTSWRDLPGGYVRWMAEKAENADMKLRARAEEARRDLESEQKPLDDVLDDHPGDADPWHMREAFFESEER